MTAAELSAVLEVLRANGVESYKSRDFKVTFKAKLDAFEQISAKFEYKDPLPGISEPLPGISGMPGWLPEKEPKIEVAEEIKHKVEELTSLMKLADQELVDAMFPDHTNYGDAEESSNTERN